MPLSPPDFILASASPRRVELLTQIGAVFEQRPVAIDEAPGRDESPRDYVQRLAVAKARTAFDGGGGLPALGSDTTVVVDDTPIGKPGNEEEAVAILRTLSGRRHRVLTAVAVVAGERCELRTSSTEVLFAAITADQARRYWRTGEPVDKAGAYAIQGLGAVFVKAIEGSYSGVVGLPLAETAELLELFNIPFWKV